MVNSPLLGCHLREEHPLEDVVANLFAQRVHVAALDGVDHFVRFFEHVMRQRFERLFAIPRTALRRPQRPHHVHQLLECLARISHRAPSCFRVFVV